MLAIFSRQTKHKSQTSPAWGQPAYATASGTNGVAKPAPLIQFDHLVKEYDTGAGPLRVLHEVALTVWPGEFVAVVGASGSGKSTLINMITGIDRPTGARSAWRATGSTISTRIKWRAGAGGTWASSTSSSNCCPR